MNITQFAFKRTLYVVLKNEKNGKRLYYGINKNKKVLEELRNNYRGSIEDEQYKKLGYNPNLEDYHIKCSIKKLMSSLGDEATIYISNLTQSDLVLITSGQYLGVEIWCGYESYKTNKVFDGSLIHISNSLDSDKTQTAILLCASKLVGRFFENKLSMVYGSGLNLYSIIRFTCERLGIKDKNISSSLKSLITNSDTSINSNVIDWLNELSKNNTNLCVNTDSITGSTFSIFDASKSNNRIIHLNESNIVISGGYPQLRVEGSEITVLPTFPFMCGDTILIDNSLFDISTSSRDDISGDYLSRFSASSLYMIYELEYDLDNRGNDFYLTLFVKNRDKVSSYVGVN